MDETMSSRQIKELCTSLSGAVKSRPRIATTVNHFIGSKIKAQAPDKKLRNPKVQKFNKLPTEIRELSWIQNGI